MAFGRPSIYLFAKNREKISFAVFIASTAHEK
jgi:hypothetical protein